MFKNKYLTQLRDVQAQIKNLKDSIDALNPPEPNSIKVGNNIRVFVDALTYKLHPDIQKIFRGYDNETYDYLYKLGEYFMNVADCEKKRKRYNEELKQLRIEECNLKVKLGIE